MLLLLTVPLVYADPWGEEDTDTAKLKVAVGEAAAARRLPPRDAPERWTLPAAVADHIRASQALPIGQRIAAASQTFLGLPYLVDAAGEGDGVDADPPARYDRFDCLTFVEEMLGIALAGDPLSAPIYRNTLRYDASADYEHRRHFMETEWIPAAIKAGLLIDITGRLGPAKVLTKTVGIDIWKPWATRHHFLLPDNRLPVGTFSLPYLDLAAAEAAAPKIPPGALVVTLRKDLGWIPVITTHVSLVVPGETEPMMRHATRMGTKKVRDDRLGWYMGHLRDYVNWPALGVMVLFPVEQGPRISALTPPPEVAR